MYSYTEFLIDDLEQNGQTYEFTSRASIFAQFCEVFRVKEEERKKYTENTTSDFANIPAAIGAIVRVDTCEYLENLLRSCFASLANWRMYSYKGLLIDDSKF